MHDPREPHLLFLKRILRYLKGTLDLGLTLHISSSHKLIAYSDVDWVGCPHTRRFTSGFCMFFGDNFISWSSRWQTTISRSSVEAEYQAVAAAVAESCWVRQLLHELQCPVTSATILFCNNVSVVYLSHNPVQHCWTKHIELGIHFLREKVDVSEVRVLHVPSSSQYADIFTKGLLSALIHQFRSSLHVASLPSSDCGGVLESPSPVATDRIPITDQVGLYPT